MADITATLVAKSGVQTVLAGERIRIQILNADGTEKTLVQDDVVPSGKTFTGLCGYSGTLS